MLQTFADLYTPLVADACVRSDKGSLEGAVDCHLRAVSIPGS